MVPSLWFALASALCLRASSVAPVRGGTYFSLPPQRKVGKRKRLTPPARVPIHGPPTSPSFTRQCPSRCSLPTPRTIASPASSTSTTASGSEWYVPPRWQTVCRLSRRIAWRFYRVERMRYRSGLRRVRYYSLHTVCHLGGAYHSLPLGRVRVFEVGEALIRSVGNEHQPGHCRVKGGDVGGPWIKTRAGGVSRFLLPTFLCGGKEK